MDRNGEVSGCMTRSRTKTIKLGENLRDQNIESSQQTMFTISFEARETFGVQNSKKPRRKREKSLNLLNLLDNLLCRDHVFSFLQVADLLRLRRVCKSAKEMSQDFIRIRKVTTQQPLKISFREKNPYGEFNQFQNGSNPLPTRTCLQVTLCDRPPILKSSCTSKITHLTIFNLQLPFIKKSTLDFLVSFPNVTHLVLDNINQVSVISNGRAVKIPLVFKNLKSLKIPDSYIAADSFGQCRLSTFIYIKILVEMCISNLEFLSLPFRQFLSDDHLIIRDLVVSLARLIIFSKTNLKLEGVTGKLMTELLRPDGRMQEMHGREEMIRNINAKVVSIDIPEREVFLQELPSLEKINFKNMADNCVLPFPEPPFSRSVWSKLREIRAHFINKNPLQNGSSLGQVWDFLFVDIVRENVVELHISFALFNRKEHVHPKSTRDFLTACPNLRILHIKSLYWHPIDLPQLWRQLTCLEQLHFTGYAEDTDFIGEDSKSPALWELKRLKVLKFFNMDEMHVTDDLFSKVVCQMPLKELHLSSKKYVGTVVKSITLPGIRSLLYGKFASTVERISIEGLEIRNVTNKKLKTLERRFRCSKLY